MDITKTSHFKIDLQHLTNLCNEYRYLTQRIEVLTNYIERTKKYRGNDYVVALIKKTNQKCQAKHFIVTKGIVTVNKDVNK